MAETEHAALRLERQVAWSSGFWLAYVFTTSPPRAHELQERVGRRLAELGKVQRVLRPATPGELEGILGEVLSGEQNVGCAWIEAIREPSKDGSDAWSSAWLRLILRTNERRELLREGLLGGLVLVAHPDMKPGLRQAAPDLWSIRSLVFELPAGGSVAVEGLMPRSVGRPFEVGPDPELLAADLARLEDVLAKQQAQEQVRTLLRFAGYLRGSGRYEEAGELGARAVAICRDLVQAQGDEFSSDLAEALNELGVVVFEFGSRKEALVLMLEAVEIRRKLAADGGDAVMEALAASLDNLGVIDWAMGKSEDALREIRAGLAIRRKLAKARPDRFDAKLANSLNNLGMSLAPMGHVAEAEEATREAIAIRRGLASRQPEAFEPVLATSLSNLGITFNAMGRPDDAFTATREAVEIFRRLSKSQPNVFEPNLAKALDVLGWIQRKQGDFEASRASLVEGLELLQPHYHRIPSALEHLARDLLLELEETCKAGNLDYPPEFHNYLITR